MKQTSRNFLLGAFLLLCSHGLWGQTGLTENFNDNVLTGWGSYRQYTCTEANGELRIDVDKTNWDGLNYSFGTIDISSHPYVSVKVKCTKALNLTCYVRDINGNYNPSKINPYEVNVSNDYTELCFNFTNLLGTSVDLTKIHQIQFDVCGAYSYTGTMYFDDLRVGTNALRTPTLTNLISQSTGMNSAAQTVKFWGVTDGTTGTNAITISATSSNTALIPNPTVSYSSPNTDGTFSYIPVTNQTGTATITLTASAPNTSASKSVSFDIKVEGNLAPTINQVTNQIVKATVDNSIAITGITDGNSSIRQSLTVTAISSDASVVPNPTVVYTSDQESGKLIVRPLKAGTAAITVTVKDNGGTLGGGVDTKTMTFNITSYADINNPPAIDPVNDVNVLINSGTTTIPLTGINDGEPFVDQNLNFVISSSRPGLIPVPTLTYTQGSSAGTLAFTPTHDSIGTSVITISITDNGGNANNNGNQTKVITFNLGVRPLPITSFADDFNDGIMGTGWSTGEGCHDVTESNGALNIFIDKSRTGNVWAGEWYSIPSELDLSASPYISITMKVSNPPQNMLIFLWDANGHYNTGGTVTQTVTGNYVEYYFDYHNKFKQGDGQTVDSSRIVALLFNFAPGAMYTGTFNFDDMRIGTAAHRPIVTPVVTISNPGGQTLLKNAPLQTINLSGISDGSDGSHTVSLTAISDNPSLVPTPSLSSISGGKASLTYTPTANAIGRAVITVTASATGCTSTSVSFNIDVVDLNPGSGSNTNVTIDRNTKYQIMDGMGYYIGGTPGLSHIGPLNDLGVSMVRMGILDEEFEPVNDNSDPNVIDIEHFNHNVFNYDNIRQIKAQTGVDKFILTWWSMPSWMKYNKSTNCPNGYMSNNKIMPEYYDEYAEHVAAAAIALRDKAGIDLYAVSLQNEPEFNEFYASSQLYWNEYKDLIKVVGPRISAEGLSTKIFWAEALAAQGNLYNYLNTVKSDATADQYTHIYAVHNYDTDGIHVGGQGAKDWANLYSACQQGANPKKTWMTETSGHSKDWNGALTLAGNIYNALKYGHISAWVYWSYDNLVNVDQSPTPLYYVTKSFYKYIQPNAQMIKVTAADTTNLYTLAFERKQDSTITVILINNGTTPITAKLTGIPGPQNFKTYLTASNKGFEPWNSVTTDGLVIVPASSVVTCYGSTDNTAPSTPANLRATDVTSTSCNLYWDASTDNIGVVAYDIYNGSTKIGSSTILGYHVTGINTGSNSYTYTVKARDAAGNLSQPSNPVLVGQGQSCNWTFAADEGGTVSFTGTKEVRYGANDSYLYKTVTTSIGCNNTDFGGDPIVGVAKHCYVCDNSTITGTVLCETWNDITGTSISSLTSNSNYPYNPSSSVQLSSLEIPVNSADNYGTRIRGYVIPTTTGSYTFYISSDDYGELWLSTDDQPANKTLIASVPGWSNSREWTKFTQQQSSAKSLVAGQKYYIEALQKEGNGGDNLAVGWTGPGISTISVISSPNISTYVDNGPVLRIPENPANAVNGIDYNFYQGQWDVLPDFSTLTPTISGIVSNFDITPRTVEDYFGFKFTGYIDAPTDGMYTFYTSSDDGSKLYIGTTEVVNNDGLHGITEKSGLIGLKAGKHAITVVFFEKTGGQSLSVSWQGPGISKQLVPNANLYRVPAGGTGLNAYYYNVQDLSGTPVLNRTDATVNFDWGNGSPDALVYTDHFSARWIGQVNPLYSETHTFYTTSDDGVRLWVNNQLIVDNWTDHPSTENSGTIALTAGQKVNIKMEYYENGGGALAKLSWSSTSLAKQIIPQYNLFPGTGSDNDRTDCGTITAQGDNAGSGEGKDKAFDNNTSTKWVDLAASSWIEYQFCNSKKYTITRYTITSANDAAERDPKSWTLKGSNDGTTWDLLDTRSNQDFVTRFEKHTYDFVNIKPYAYYRFDLTNHSGTIIQLSEIELIEQNSLKSKALGSDVIPTTSSITGHIDLYPNPANTEVNLKFKAESEQDVRIYMVNSTGQLVLLKQEAVTTGDNLLNLNVEGLSRGVYFITIQKDGQTNKLRFIKN